MSAPAMRQSLQPDFSEAEAYPPVTEQLCQEIVERIRSAGRPLKVILFGSRARGDYRPTSDLDILIVEREHPVSRETKNLYIGALCGIYPETTVIVDSLHDIQLWSRVPGHILTEALRQGRVLYEAPADIQYELGRIENLFVAEETPYKTSADLARHWLMLGDRDLADCRILRENDGSPESICFLLQQAIEKYLKGFRGLCEQPDMKTHDLEALSRDISKYISIPELDNISEEKLEKISKYVFECRYGDNFCVTQEEVEEARAIAQSLRTALAAKLEST